MERVSTPVVVENWDGSAAERKRKERASLWRGVGSSFRAHTNPMFSTASTPESPGRPRRSPSQESLDSTLCAAVGSKEGSSPPAARGRWRTWRPLFVVLALCAGAVAVAVAVFWLRGVSSVRVHLPDRAKLDCVAVDRHQAAEAPPLVSAWVFKDVASNGSIVVRGRANMSATAHTKRQILTIFDGHAWVQEYGSILNDEDDDGDATASELMLWGVPRCAAAGRLPLATELQELMSSLALADVSTTSDAETQFGWTCSPGETALLVNSGKKPALVCVDAEWVHVDVVTRDFHASCAVDTSATLSSIEAVDPAPPSLDCGSSPLHGRQLAEIAMPCTLASALDELHLTEEHLLRAGKSWDQLEKIMGGNWETTRSKIESTGAALRRGSDKALKDVPCDHKKVRKQLWGAVLNPYWSGSSTVADLASKDSWDDVQLSLGDSSFASFVAMSVKGGAGPRQGSSSSLQDMRLEDLFFWMNLWEDSKLKQWLDFEGKTVVDLLGMSRSDVATLSTHLGASSLVSTLSGVPATLTQDLRELWTNDRTAGKHVADSWLRWRIVSEITASSTVAFVEFVDQPFKTKFRDANLAAHASNSTAFDMFSAAMETYGLKDQKMGKLFRRSKLPSMWPLAHTRTKLSSLGMDPVSVAGASEWGDLSVSALESLDGYLNAKGFEREPDNGVKLKNLPQRMCLTHLASDKWSNNINDNTAKPPALLPKDFTDASDWPNKFERTGLNGLLPQVKHYAEDHTRSGDAGSFHEVKDLLRSWLVIDEVTGEKVVKHMDSNWDSMKTDHRTEFDAVVAKLAEHGAEPELNHDGIYPVSLIQKLNAHCGTSSSRRRLNSPTRARVLQPVVNITNLKVTPNALDIPRRRRHGFDSKASSKVRGSACLTLTMSGGTTPAGDGACASHTVVQLVTAATAGLAPLSALPAHPFDETMVNAATSYSYLYGSGGDANDPSRVVKAAVLHRVCAAVDSLAYTGARNAPPLLVFAHGVANVWLAEALRLNACSLGEGGVWMEMQPAGANGLRDVAAWGESWCDSMDGAMLTTADEVGLNTLGRFCGLIPAEYPAIARATPRQVWLDLMSVRVLS